MSDNLKKTDLRPGCTRIIAAAAAVGLAASALLTGCGSDSARTGSAAASGGRGTLSFTVKWPAPTRLIPSASNSIKFIVSTDAAGANVVAGVVVNRPSTSATLNNVPAGVEYVTATAYPNPGAVGVPQASASGQVFVNPGQVTPVILTLGSTVDHIDLVETASGGSAVSGGSPATQFTLPNGAAHSIQLLATARDSSNNMVVVDNGSSSNLTWSSDNTAVASASPTKGSLVTVTGGTPGTANLTVTYAEGGVTIKTAVARITVTQYIPTFVATTTPMTTARAENTATLLPTGKVLIAGNSYAELYDPSSGQFSATGALTTIRTKHAAALLADGTVLLVGGDSAAPPPGASQTPGTNALNTAEIYSSGSFTAVTATMASPREYATATTLQSGKVLVAGGSNGAQALNTAEIFDPAARTFTAVPGTMSSARFNHTATLLPDGTVLIAGGHTGAGPTASADIFDPALNGGAGGFRSPALTMSQAREAHTATLFSAGPFSGEVLIAGGAAGTPGLTAEIYNPGAGSFTAIGASSMISDRFGAAAVTFSTGALAGKVLITGGRTQYAGGTVLNTAEVFVPTALTFVATSDPMTTARHTHTATLLPNGTVLIAGGSNGAANLNTAEVTSNANTL